MTQFPPNPRVLNQRQLDVIGIFLLCLIGVVAWNVATPLTWYSLVPLLCLVYAAFRIVFELTINRSHVPTLATGFVCSAKITGVLQQDAAKRGKAPYTIIDLGSGRGGLARHLAKEIPNAQVIGIEMARVPYWQADFVQRWFGPKNLSYLRQDFWQYDCSGVDAVMLYLIPTMMPRVGEKLQKELKPGSLVISHTFPLLGAWAPIDVLQFRTPFKETIYVYRKE